MRGLTSGLARYFGLVLCGVLIAPLLQFGFVEAAADTVGFQGKLTNPDGTNLSDGLYSLRFRIYTDPSTDSLSACTPGSTSCLWEETQSVSLENGIFNVKLGELTPLVGTVDFSLNNLYLGIRVESDTEMTPRIGLSASPFALNSDRLDGLDAGNFVQLGQGLQVDASNTSPSIYINKANTAGTPHIVQIQRAGTDVFLIDNAGGTTITGSLAQSTGTATLSGDISLGTNTSSFSAESGSSVTALFNGASPHTVALATGSAAQTVSIGSTHSTSSLTLSAGSGNALLTVSAGDILLQTTTSGSISLAPAAVDGNNVTIGSVDAVGNLLVLDTKTTPGDPTGVNGGIYYNSSSGTARCYESNVWADCAVNRVLAESTLSSDASSIDLSIPAEYEYLHCRLDIKGRTTNSRVNMRANNNSSNGSYSWNLIGIIAAATTDWQDNNDTEIQISGTVSGTVAFSADIQITNFADTNKVVTWTAGGLEAVGTNPNFYSGIGGFFDSTNAITSVQFFPNSGNFTAGSHAWCEGRNVQ